MKKLEDIVNNTIMPKSALIRALDELIANGFDRKAKQLDRIIGKLEEWQNKK